MSVKVLSTTSLLISFMATGASVGAWHTAGDYKNFTQELALARQPKGLSRAFTQGQKPATSQTELETFVASCARSVVARPLPLFQVNSTPYVSIAYPKMFREAIAKLPKSSQTPVMTDQIRSCVEPMVAQPYQSPTQLEKSTAKLANANATATLAFGLAAFGSLILGTMAWRFGMRPSSGGFVLGGPPG